MNAAIKDKFKLFATCVPVKGASRSTICDIQRGKIEFIPNSLYDMLNKFDGKSKKQVIDSYGAEHQGIIEEYFDFLITNEFGFWCAQPELFPPLNIDVEIPSKIVNGIVDSCSYSNHNFSVIFENFNRLGCRHLELRFYDYSSIETLTNNLRLLDSTRIKSVELILKFDSDIAYEKILKLVSDTPRISSVTLHTSPKFERKKYDYLGKSIPVLYLTTAIDSEVHCGQINHHYFSINKDTFFESLKFNTCLNKKISVDVNGDIKNCPSMKSSYGNIADKSFEQILENAKFKELWSISKDQIEVCKDCEFRHVCTDCRAYLEGDNSHEKPSKCNYNPYQMIWE